MSIHVHEDILIRPVHKYRMKRRRLKTPPQTDEYKQLLRILGNMDLELSDGISLDLLIEEVVEAEVKARVGWRFNRYYDQLKWWDHRNVPDLENPDVEAVPAKQGNVIGI